MHVTISVAPMNDMIVAFCTHSVFISHKNGLAQLLADF